MQRTLVLIRHAEAENAWGIPDIERSLTMKGRSQAHRLGVLLKTAGITFDKLYVSAAQRTQDTAHELLKIVTAQSVMTRGDLYLPSREAVHEVSYELDDEASVGILIHEPAVSQMGEYYARSSADLKWGVSVATALILRWEGGWADLGSGIADLEMLCGSE